MAAPFPCKEFVLSIAIAVWASHLMNAQTSFNVPGKANLYAAGVSVENDGEPPVAINLDSRFHALEFVNVAGTVANGVWSSPPNGDPRNANGNYLGTLIESVGGLSSLIVLHRFAFLTGVFLSSPAPVSKPPVGLTFTDADTFEILSPAIAQPFYIGDGFTGAGKEKHRIFQIPEGATRLFLGISDACALDSLTPPSCYGDNSGAFSGTINFLAK